MIPNIGQYILESITKSNDTQIYLGFLFNIYNKIINKDER